MIVLTARGDPHDRVEGLESGADDYLPKPFHFEELVARIRVQLRGRRPQRRADPASRRRRWRSTCAPGGRASPARRSSCRAREFELLRTFLQHPNQVLSREQLLARVWGYDYDPGSNVVDVYVGYLRKKLGAPKFETVRGVGYRFRA